MGKVYLGTSGWSYSWPKFYPSSCSKKEELSYYALHFNAVEINYSFYKLPSAATCKKWAEMTPSNFQFAVKLSRYITHVKRLKGVKTPCKTFKKRVFYLGKKLGPILVQIPENFHLDLERLQQFFQDWGEDKKYPLALEFRHESWFTKEVYALLKKYHASLVFSQAESFPYPEEEPLTSSFIYIRLHGPRKLYDSEYGKENLKILSSRVRKWKKRKKVYLFFNNDGHGYAPKDATILKHLLQRKDS